MKKQYKVYLIDMTVRMPPATRMIAQANFEILLSDSRVWVRPPIVVKCKNHFKTEVKLPQAVVEIPTSLRMLSVMKKIFKIGSNQHILFASKKYFVNLKSNRALLYNKGHNLLTSAFPPKLVKLIKFPLKSWIFPY